MPGRLLQRGINDLREGARSAWALSLASPPADQPLRRLAHGFALSWVVLGIALKDRGSRGAYLRTLLPVSLLTLALGVFAVTSPWTQSFFHKEEREPKPKSVVPRVVVPGMSVAIGDEPDADDADDADDEARVLPTRQEEAEVPPPPASAPEATNPRLAAPFPPPPLFEAPPSPVAPSATNPRLAAPFPPPPLFAAPSAATPELRRPVEPGDEDDNDEPAPPEHWSLPTLSALYAALALVERGLLALTRDHQNMLSRRLCLATGASPEDEELKPRLRVTWKWIRKKIQRKVRSTLILGAIAPLAALVEGMLGRWPAAAVAGAWGGYWLCVFAVGATGIAWREPPPEAQPFFVRWCERAGRVPVVGWLLRPYGKLLRRLTRGVRAACLSAEQAPLEAIGLGLARALTGLPVINGFCRPVLPVAAQLALRPRLSPG